MFNEQINHYAWSANKPAAPTYTYYEREELREKAMKYAKEVFAKSDKNHDGCLDEDEWEGPPTPPPPAGPAPAGPPPPHTGESRVEGGDQLKPGPLDTETEFNLMDSNGA